MALANPTLVRAGSTIPGYAVTQGTASAAQQAPSTPRSSQISASDSFAGERHRSDSQADSGSTHVQAALVSMKALSTGV